MEKAKKEIIPYLSFQGNCEEAVKAYIEAFGGEILFISRWNESNFDVTPEQVGKVMHVEFILGNTRRRYIRYLYWQKAEPYLLRCSPIRNRMMMAADLL